MVGSHPPIVHALKTNMLAPYNCNHHVYFSLKGRVLLLPTLVGELYLSTWMSVSYKTISYPWRNLIKQLFEHGNMHKCSLSTDNVKQHS